MTICISAIGKDQSDNEIIVFSTDHMVSVSVGQFEQDIEKYIPLNKNTVAMLSGNAILKDMLFDDLSEFEGLTYKEICKKLHDKMIQLKFQLIQNEIFTPAGIDFEIARELLVNPLPNPFIEKILHSFLKHNLNTTLLVIGFQGNLAQISEVNELANIPFRSMNFHAIGSGSTQAINTLMFQKQSKKDSIRTTLYNVYKAKRNSEVSVGVGKETDLFLLSKEGIIPINDDQIEILKRVYEEELKFGKENKDLKDIKV